MELNSMVVGPLGVNCYIISEKGNAVVVDPGGHSDEIIDFLESNGLKPLAIVNTHGHFDHIGGVTALIEKYDIPFLLHKDDEFLCSHGAETSVMFGFDKMRNPQVTSYLEDKAELDFEGIKITVIHTPGHSPGGVALYLKDIKSVLTGDSLFLESVGRSDFPYASTEQLLKSIKDGLFTLPDDTKVYPGHGPASSIGHEKSYNPFL